MSTGWKYILSDGREMKNQVAVKQALQEDPTLRVQFSELSMAGTKLTDVTDKFRKRHTCGYLLTTEQRFCSNCGGLL